MNSLINKYNCLLFIPAIWGLTAVGCQREPKPNRVVVVGMDGLEMSMLQRMISAGELPNFQRIFDEGYAGPLETIEPMLSPAIWTTIASGYLPEVHGVYDWINPNGRLTNSTNVNTSRIWETISRFDRSSLISGWLMTTPATPFNGIMLSDRLVWNMSMDSRSLDESASIEISQSSINDHMDQVAYPEELATVAERWLPTRSELEASPLSYQLRSYGVGRHPLPKDEVHLRAFESLWSDQDLAMLYMFSADQVSHLYWPFSDPDLIQQMTDDSSLRINQFEELRSTSGHENDQRAFPLVSTPTTREQLDQASRWVPDTYRWLDQAIGRVIDKVDPVSTTLIVVSDHGFQRANQLSAIDSNHRNPGVILAWGGALKHKGVSAQTIEASVSDLTPTILALLGVPIAEDMGGKTLSELFHLDSVNQVESWRTRNTSGSAPVSDPQELLEQLRALGYLNEQ